VVVAGCGGVRLEMIVVSSMFVSQVIGPVWLDVLKFNKHCGTFVLFDKKFLILD
jgi:hypothetical protein